MQESPDLPRTARNGFGWEVTLLLILAAAVYQPWSVTALPILDFSEFLPLLAAHKSPFEQFSSIAAYMGTQGRFSPLIYAHIVIAWNAFGMWAPGWHWTYFLLNSLVLIVGYQFLLRIGVRRAAAFAALAVWTIAPPVAAGWIRPTGEPTGLLLLLIALWHAYNFAMGENTWRHCIVIGLCIAGMIGAKEMLAVLIPVVWLMTRLVHEKDRWSWARWGWRDIQVTAAAAAGTLIGMLPVLYVALTAPIGNYAGRYGSVKLGLAPVVNRFESAILPSRVGLPGVRQLMNDPQWQSWLAFPNLLWLTVLIAGLVSIIMSRQTRGSIGSKWPLLIAALWVIPGVVAYVPWPSKAGFYMLPFAFGVAFLAAHLMSWMATTRLTQIVVGVAVIEVIAIGAIEARDIRSEHDLKVTSDVRILSEVAKRGIDRPLVAAVPDPAPPGTFGWGRMLAEYGRVSGTINPKYSGDVSCKQGRLLIASQVAVTVVTADKGCGPLQPGASVVSETVERQRWPLFFEGLTNRRITFVAGS